MTLYDKIKKTVHSNNTSNFHESVMPLPVVIWLRELCAAIEQTEENIPIKTLDSSVKLPKYASEGASGLDICANLHRDFISIDPGDIAIIPTGLQVAIPVGYEIQIRSRSGLASKGIVVVNSPGTLDSDYRGEIKVILTNVSRLPYCITHGDRIAQMVLSKVSKVQWAPTEELSDTVRGAGGLGSSGMGNIPSFIEGHINNKM